MLPETMNRQLPDTIQDAHNLNSIKKLPNPSRQSGVIKVDGEVSSKEEKSPFNNQVLNR